MIWTDSSPVDGHRHRILSAEFQAEVQRMVDGIISERLGRSWRSCERCGGMIDEDSSSAFCLACHEMILKEKGAKK